MDLLVKQDRNLCDIFILPLVQRSLRDFTTFISSYVDISTYQVVVEIKELHSRYAEYPHFEFSIQNGSESYLIFYSIPIEFHKDVEKFIDGKYSEFSKMAKEYIYKYSGLQRANNRVSVWLYVIDKSEKLREALESQLNCSIPVNVELASKPDTKNFLNVHDFKRLSTESC